MIPSPPTPTAIDLGPITIGWYGIGYVVGLAVLLYVSAREAERRGYDGNLVWEAFLLVAALALIGGRLYHVIDQWGACGPGEPCYSQNLLRIVLPPYAGLGLYGGIAGAIVGLAIFTRWKHLPLRLALDVVVPGTFFAQAIARWGNFFNQELYGPPTSAPWGILIDCTHRVAEWPCSVYPYATTGFHPLFFYESALDLTGGLIALYISRRYLPRIIPGDLTAFWFIWYGTIRGLLEFFRSGWNWTVGGIATAQWIGIVVVIFGIALIAWNHRPGHSRYEYRPPFQRQKPTPTPAEPQPSD